MYKIQYAHFYSIFRCLPAIGILLCISLIWSNMGDRVGEEKYVQKLIRPIVSGNQSNLNIRFAQTAIKGGSHFILQSDDGYVSYLEFIKLLGESSDMRALMTSTLRSVDYPAYFWESIPISATDAPNTPYEFVLLSTRSFEGLDPDVLAFKAHFDACSAGASVVSFPNLGSDAILVTPCPREELTPHCGHLANFIRYAREDTLDTFWQLVAKKVQQRMRNKDTTFWLSTSGLGVTWLHVRIDDYPKYYNYMPYKRREHK